MLIARKFRVLLQIAVCMALLAGPLAAQEAVSLAGSGSNLAGSLYFAWTAQFEKLHPAVKVRYLPLGTSASIKEIREGKGDFGGGEIPLTASQKHSGTSSLTQFPTILVAIAPIYKLPGNPELRFSGELLAKIYLGIIRNWKDPLIARLNPDVSLPNLPITVVHLSGVKGSNYILADFLSKTSPDWKSRIGKTASPDWPVGLEINRSEAMVTKVSATPGAIGYVEFAYAKSKNVGYASVQNAAGLFVKPTPAAIAAACTASDKYIPEDLGASLTNAPGKESYPLASFTWIYVPAQGLDPARSRALKDFWIWTLADGQEIATSLGFTPLPPAIASRSKQALLSIK
ncbi:MAG: phosphate ABC transporter substrate-binding protein PstS [Acidobacteriia bacterium]|nr:phosphate ABC transporter substrate-binding protein PstS [Terriglobia bacterium]